MASGFLSDLLKSFMFGLAGKTSTVSTDTEVAVPPNFRGVPVLDPEKCILCGRCGTVCPAGAITLSTTATEKSVRIFVGHCIFCSECSMICPVSAITMTDIWDTTVADRLSLDTMNTREIKQNVREKAKKRAADVDEQQDSNDDTQA